MPTEPCRESAPALLPVIPPGASIPKRICQVYSSKELPPPIEASVRRIRALNPNWEYRLYDDRDMAEFVANVYGERMLDYYNRVNWKYGAARADFFRYLLMYRHGGVYLDIKSSMERPLDQVLRGDDVYLLSRWPNDEGERYEGWGLHRQLKGIERGEFQQWHIVAAPGHPFLRAVIESVMRNIDDYNPVLHDVGKGGVLRLSGPIAYTRAIAPLLDTQRYRLVNSHDDLGLTYNIYRSVAHDAHKSIFRYHYTRLTEPVVRLTVGRRLAWMLFGPVRNYFIVPTLDLIDRVARGLTGKPVRRA